MSSCDEFVRKFIKQSEALGKCKSGFFEEQMRGKDIPQSDCDKIATEVDNLRAQSIKNGATKEAQRHLDKIYSDAEQEGYNEHEALTMEQQGNPYPLMRARERASVMWPLRETEIETYCGLMAERESPKI